MSRVDKAEAKKDRRRRIAAEIANTFEWVITAFILALVFRAFVIEAFRIPTGSMADTLKGAHFRLRCSQCGYRYDYGFPPEKYGLLQDTVPSGPVRPPQTRCPSCGYISHPKGAMWVSNGDRILVLKCIYQFFEPKRWDVVVFKNPLDPTISYIKRLIGRPGEMVEIIDGDVYIDGRIARKPTKVQDNLWMTVYDNDYQPVQPLESYFNNHQWRQPFRNFNNSNWDVGSKEKPTIFQLNSPPDEINWLIYDTTAGNDFKATYAYDEVQDYYYMPYCSDLMVRFYIGTEQQQGQIGISLSKYESEYHAWVNLAGEMGLTKKSQDQKTQLISRQIGPQDLERPIFVKFANIDHQLIFQFGDETLTYDLGSGPDDAGPRRADIQSQVKIFGSGEISLSHIAVCRDIHYTSGKQGNSYEHGRATEGRPFTLGQNEFFALGDNSPCSLDGRWWSKAGIGNNDSSYRMGIVPRNYLVGKALFVYWPGGFRLFGKSRFAFIPNIGQLRLIHGGSGKNQ